MANIIQYMPFLDDEELALVGSLAATMNENQAQIFSHGYLTSRKEPQTILAVSVIGLVSFPGLQRLVLGQIGLGLLYLFTGGLLLIGSIYDLVKYKRLTFEYNRKVAEHIAARVLNPPIVGHQ
jgi:TM2 domain-containing membrane protein YozV